MGKPTEIWGLFRVSDQQKFEGVQFSELEFLFRVLSPDERSQYLFWHPKAGRWIKLESFEKVVPISKSGSQQKTASSSFKEEKPTLDHAAGVVDQDSLGAPSQKMKVFEFDPVETGRLSLDKRAARDSRSDVRYDRRFRVRILTPAGPIKNATLDASMKGLKLEEPIPEGLPQFFYVEVQLGADKRVSLLCSVVKAKNGQPRNRLKIHKNENPVLFKAMLFNAA